MAIFGHDPKHVEPIGPGLGRIPVLLLETDEPHVHVHGLVLAPSEMTLDMAKQAITNVFVEIRKENSSDWSYDDLNRVLAERGFLVLSVGMWEEYADGYPR